MNIARLDRRRGPHGQPGLELWSEVYRRLNPAKWWLKDSGHRISDPFNRWMGRMEAARKNGRTPSHRSGFELYLCLRLSPDLIGAQTGPEVWRQFVETLLIRHSPGLRWIVNHDPDAIDRLVAVLDGPLRHRTPESLTIALTAAALKKDRKSVARRLNLGSSPVSIYFVPRPPPKKAALKLA